MTIDELLKSKDISYRQSGRDYLIRCLSPDHEDRNPSLRVDRTTGIFNCLSCGFKGNIFDHFGEKANWLQIRREKLKNVINSKLVESAGLTIPKNAVPFERDWRGISASTFQKFNAFEHANPEFLSRVMFPISNITGKIASFCGRHLGDGKPKYLFHPPGAKLPLFPIVKPINGNIIIVEGIFDMLNLHDKGLTNAVCAFGVNKVDQDKVNILKIQGITGIDIFFDNDEAGQTAATKLREFLDKNEFITRNIVFEHTNDPGELTASKVIKLKETLYGENSSSTN